MILVSFLLLVIINITTNQVVADKDELNFTYINGILGLLNNEDECELPSYGELVELQNTFEELESSLGDSLKLTPDQKLARETLLNNWDLFQKKMTSGSITTFAKKRALLSKVEEYQETKFGFSICAQGRTFMKLDQERGYIKPDEIEMNRKRVSVRVSKQEPGRELKLQSEVSPIEELPIMNDPGIIKVVPSPKETGDGDTLFTLQYNAGKNFYDSSLQLYRKKEWSSLTYDHQNIDHKFEWDWKVCYIARKEGSPWNRDGKLRWRFYISRRMTWNRLEIQLNGNVYDGTSIDLSLANYDPSGTHKLEEIKLDLNARNIVTPDQFKHEVIILDLVVTLTGGQIDDSRAWQKPQLFRQKCNSKDWPLIFNVY